jgi:hypothetical protein
MARRRMISQTIVYDEEFNTLTIEAQNLFIRMLSVADDCGVVPASLNALSALTNPPARMRKNLARYLGELSALGGVFEYKGKPYFIFKSDSYRRHQSYIINKRERSEYLKITAEAFDSIAFKSYDEHMKGICDATLVVSNKQRVESSKKKEGSGEKTFQAPKFEEVEQYFLAHDYPSEVAHRAFDYYAEAQPPWTDSRGHPVRSWKSKMQAVWFKSENKTNGNNLRKGQGNNGTDRTGKRGAPSDFTNAKQGLS